MSGMFTLAGFAAKLIAIDHDMRTVEARIVAKACEMVAARAREVIDTYTYGWPQLADVTQQRRIKAGYPGNEPLLVTGELRGSITWSSSGNEGVVGSNLDKAVWHELGTGRIPPRPFLWPAAKEMGPKIATMAGKAVAATLRGHGPGSSQLHDLLHMLHYVKQAGEAIVDAAKDVVREDKQERRR